MIKVDLKKVGYPKITDFDDFFLIDFGEFIIDCKVYYSADITYEYDTNSKIVEFDFINIYEVTYNDDEHEAFEVELDEEILISYLKEYIENIV